MQKSLPSSAVRWLLDFSTFENYTVAAFIISLAFFLQLMASDRQEPASNSLEARKMHLHWEKSAEHMNKRKSVNQRCI